MTLITPQQAADQLAIRVETVYRLLQEGVLPVACHIGPRIRLSQDALDEWIRNGGSGGR